ncbi:MAG: 3-deoxy-8-phosphooctulonate synthase [Planctomycetota bacterium]|nr:3-deoxy-8-phosphooctulonate synthase [Planctomycetota bacterium]
MYENCSIGPIQVGTEHPLLVMAGPCVLESSKINDSIALTMKALSHELGFNYIFKASFDKANRSSIHSDRGPGLEAGLAELTRIGGDFDLGVMTDVHEPDQVPHVAPVVDLLQIPAFLCRQTDLLMACAASGKAVNVKKGQFMAPAEMTNVVNKLQEGGCQNLMLTERGTFFGYHRLVNDFIGLGDLMTLGPPVCFDVTHSTQLPGGGHDHSTGRPDRARLLARAATAAGVPALFIETHPDPSTARSDGSTVQPLTAMKELLEEVISIRNALAPAHAKGT